MSPMELAAFVVAAGPSQPLGALLIAETAGNSTRLWGSSVGVHVEVQQPFCDWGGAAAAYFLKTGGDPNKTEGWDQGILDKCCSVDPTDCIWFGTLAACESQSPATCRQCAPGQTDMGCPAWSSGSAGTPPLASKYLDVPPHALARLSAMLTPNQNFSFQALVVAPSDDWLTVDSIVFPTTIPGVTFSCFSTQVR